MVYFRFSTNSNLCIIKYFLSQSGKIIKVWEKKVFFALRMVYFGFETKFYIRYPIVKAIEIFIYSNGICHDVIWVDYFNWTFYFRWNESISGTYQFCLTNHTFVLKTLEIAYEIPLLSIEENVDGYFDRAKNNWYLFDFIELTFVESYPSDAIIYLYI